MGNQVYLVPSNFTDHGEPSVFGPLQLLQLAVFFRCALWDADSAYSDLLAKFRGEEEMSIRTGPDLAGGRPGAQLNTNWA